MGHDISAYTGSNLHPFDHLRIGGIYRSKTKIYKALEAEQFNATDSGTGEYKSITLDQLKQAVKSRMLRPDELKFLSRLIDNYDPKRELTLKFN